MSGRSAEALEGAPRRVSSSLLTNNKTRNKANTLVLPFAHNPPPVQCALSSGAHLEDNCYRVQHNSDHVHRCTYL